ncbi:MAG: LacI family DNA-binding transcriptional regulator [Galactobacter sp.]
MPSPKEDAPKRPTIRDVAAVAGVSKSLVSRAFVDPQRVGSDSLKRINDAANRMGFAPSWSARTLNGPDGGFVGIVVSDLYSPAFAPMVIGAYRRLKSEGLDVLLSAASLSEPGADRTLEEAPIAFLRGLRPTKMIVIGGVHDMSTLAPLATAVPTVVAGVRDVALDSIAEVFTDDDAGMDLVVEHLTGLGHTRITHLAGIGRVGTARSQAYVQAMNVRGLGHQIHVESADFEEAAGYAAASRVLDAAEPPTAITAAGDPAAIGALAAVRERGALVSVVGYGNAPSSSYRLAQLTTVDPDNQTIGAQAAETLLRAQASHPKQGQHLHVPPRLILRSTTHPVV